MFDGVLDHGQRRHIARVQDIGNVAVRKDIAGIENQDCRFWNSGIRAAEPEELRGLFAGKIWEV